MRTVTRTLVAACLGLSMTGCILVADGDSKTYQPTVGRQLCDLKAAHDTGAINDTEYQNSKTKLLSNCR